MRSWSGVWSQHVTGLSGRSGFGPVPTMGLADLTWIYGKRRLRGWARGEMTVIWGGGKRDGWREIPVFTGMTGGAVGVSRLGPLTLPAEGQGLLLEILFAVVGFLS